jgi:hypothetical protein
LLSLSKSRDAAVKRNPALPFADEFLALAFLDERAGESCFLLETAR